MPGQPRPVSTSGRKTDGPNSSERPNSGGTKLMFSVAERVAEAGVEGERFCRAMRMEDFICLSKAMFLSKGAQPASHALNTIPGACKAPQ